MRGLIKQARRTGMSSAQVATRTEFLGWYTPLGSMGSAAIRALAGGAVLQVAVRAKNGWAAPHLAHLGERSAVRDRAIHDRAVLRQAALNKDEVNAIE